MSGTLTVAVCGGRNYADAEQVFKSLDRVHAIAPIEVLIHGAAPGADTLAENWAKSREVNYVGIPAKWKKHGYPAGPIRNSEVVASSPLIHFLIAFPGGTGTADMVKKCEAREIPILRSPGRIRVSSIQQRALVQEPALSDRG